MRQAVDNAEELDKVFSKFRVFNAINCCNTMCFWAGVIQIRLGIKIGFVLAHGFHVFTAFSFLLALIMSAVPATIIANPISDVIHRSCIAMGIAV